MQPVGGEMQTAGRCNLGARVGKGRQRVRGKRPTRTNERSQGMHEGCAWPLPLELLRLGGSPEPLEASCRSGQGGCR